MFELSEKRANCPTLCVLPLVFGLPWPVPFTASGALLVPVAGILSTHLVLGEPLSGDVLAGGSLILAGIALSLRGSRPTGRAHSSKDAPPRVA